MTDSQAHPEPAGDPDSETPSDLLQERTDEVRWPDEHPDEVDRPANPGGPYFQAAPEDSAPAEQAMLIGCTVAGPGRLPAARVLADSFLRNHPGARFVVLPIDGPAEVRGELLAPERIGVDADEFARLAVSCTADELRAVLRPRLLRHLLSTGATLLYLEPSVQVFNEFDDLLRELTPDRPVGLVPRVLRTLYSDGYRPSAADLAESGPFDPSVLAVRPGAEDFLDAWAEQVSADPSAGVLLDSAPALADHLVLRDPGVGLSVWNAAQRELITTADGSYAADGSLLRSVHFDGFQPERPWLLSTHFADRPRVLLSEHPVLAGLCASYRNALVEAGYTHEPKHPYDALPDGTPLPAPLRRDYLAAWQRGEQPASPFQSGDGAREFLDWACEPADDAQRAQGGSRWTAAVWRGDPVLRGDYPDPFGVDADAFHEWCAGVGVASGRVPEVAVRGHGDAERSALVDQLGVAVLGTGRIAELVRAAVRASGLPSADTPYYPVVLRCEPGLPVPAGRHVIDVQPDGAAESPEIWVLSESARQASRRTGGPTARVVSLPVLDPGPVDLPKRKGARARYGLSDEFVVGAFADHADERRDNVLGLVTAFLTAFPDREDVRLLIAVSGAARYPEAAERLKLATVSDSRVVLVDDETDTGALPAAADCVASLHRAEGGDRYALRLLEIAARGVPVLAADHGAVAELLGGHGARLVACQGQGEPDLEAAAAMLRETADDPDGTASFGAAARDYVLGEHSVGHAAERLREHVEHAYRNWRTKWAKDRHGDLDDPLRPLLAARHALHRAPDVGGGGRNTVAPALRKAVLRMVSHYDEHIRDVMRSLVDGVEKTAAELLRRQYDADSGGEEFDLLRNDLARSDQRTDRLEDRLTSADDGMVRARADLADQHRRLRALETRVAEPAERPPERTDALAERLDSLTSAVERTLDRIDALERERAEEAQAQELESNLRSATHDAAHALHRTDVLQRILLREHERNTGTGDGSTSPVLCDAGLLRLPADDSLMLPWLSSHATWDAEVSALIDSLLEPDGIFLDVGSYVGYQTVRVLSRLGNSGAVVAVEPAARDRELLQHNVEVNVPTAWGHRLVVLDGAAWDSPAELVVEPALSGGLAVRPPAESEQDGERITGVRLDRELENRAELEDLKLSVVHVDVGARVHRILGGLVRLLRRDRPAIVCTFTPAGIEELGDDPASALREFGTWGYELVPVGRTHAVSASELLEAIETAGEVSTVKLWLRPKGKPHTG